MIFTTSSVPFKASAPPLFKDKGDTNGYPGPVSESCVYGLSTQINKGFQVFKATLTQQIISSYTGTAKNFCGIFKEEIPFPFDYPPVALAFDSNKLTDNTLARLTALEFTEDTFGRIRYLKGQIV
jgi:hypothetical protein